MGASPWGFNSPLSHHFIAYLLSSLEIPPQKLSGNKMVLKTIFLIISILIANSNKKPDLKLLAQDIRDHSALKNGMWSIYAKNLTTGNILIDMNSSKSMIPASNLKLITSAVALDLLGEDFTLKTTVGRRSMLPSNSISTLATRLSTSLGAIIRGSRSRISGKLPGISNVRLHVALALVIPLSVPLDRERFESIVPKQHDVESSKNNYWFSVYINKINTELWVEKEAAKNCKGAWVAR